MAVGQNVYLTSTSGTYWTKNTLSNVELYDVTDCGGVFVAVGYDWDSHRGAIFHSYDSPDFDTSNEYLTEEDRKVYTVSCLIPGNELHLDQR